MEMLPNDAIQGLAISEPIQASDGKTYTIATGVDVGNSDDSPEDHALKATTLAAFLQEHVQDTILYITPDIGSSEVQQQLDQTVLAAVKEQTGIKNIGVLFLNVKTAAALELATGTIGIVTGLMLAVSSLLFASETNRGISRRKLVISMLVGGGALMVGGVGGAVALGHTEQGFDRNMVGTSIETAATGNNVVVLIDSNITQLDRNDFIKGLQNPNAYSGNGFGASMSTTPYMY